MTRAITIVLFIFTGTLSYSQVSPGYWQQRAEYQMEVDLNVENHQFTGTQKLIYYNNSPDTLFNVYYHLYFNAFQPGSMMDVRSRTIADPDSRVGSRIAGLSEKEQGYLHVNKLKQDGKLLQTHEEGTILEVKLAKPILPGKKVKFTMEFEGQVPLQVRRTGRDNAEGIDYSMSQWYPKMVEYDIEGWNANPYIAREFHGVWGDFDVKITIDSSYTVAASGLLQNPKEIGHGYLEEGASLKRPKGDQLTWHFIAEDVHDFTWAADPDYKHVKAQVPNGPELHFFYQQDSLTRHWFELPEYTIKIFEFMSENFGEYPYPQYSVVQGGDGGMEYAMLTLITGHRGLGSLTGVTAHEIAHSWYQMVLATNEALYPWIDEGFASYTDNLIMQHLFNTEDPHHYSYLSYYRLVESGLEEPMSTHADFYHTNQAYGTAAYGKGSVFLQQLGYIIGQKNLNKTMRRFFNEWKFKHPTPTDFKRVAEKVSGMQLDWYFEQWINTTNTINYAIKTVYSAQDSTYVIIERQGKIPMPVELLVTFEDGAQALYYIPLRIMRGEKDNETDVNRSTLRDWPWVNPTYSVSIPNEGGIKKMEIDPSGRMADVDRKNNTFDLSEIRKSTY